MTAEIVLPDYRLFPYERGLAEREIKALDLRLLAANEERWLVESPLDATVLRRLTYVARVVTGDGVVLQPDVALMESAHKRSRGRADGRQATRYHLHGLHEYKGKFNPQVVRSFANLLGLRPGDWLADPFCGSGTALLEGASIGANVLGIDRSPMAAYLAQTKLRTLRTADPAALAATLEHWMEASIPAVEMAEGRSEPVSSGLAHLDARTITYLESWFNPSTLAGLSAALAEQSRLSGTSRALVSVAISSLCRTVSLQLPQDLRVRRRPPGFVAPSTARLLSEALLATVGALLELEEASLELGAHGEVRRASATSDPPFASLRGRRSRCVVISSPPYATALPYIDTDRLSIALLGLASSAELRALESSLVGSREWSTTDRRRWQSRLDANADGLPRTVLATCSATHSDSAGFRRRAVPGLLYRYFTQMRDALAATRRALRPGEPAVFIVGSNRTSDSNGGMLAIDTPRLLSDVSQQVGFELLEMVDLETWPRFGLHAANGIGHEAAIWLRARDA